MVFRHLFSNGAQITLRAYLDRCPPEFETDWTQDVPWREFVLWRDVVISEIYPEITKSQAQAMMNHDLYPFKHMGGTCE